MTEAPKRIRVLIATTRGPVAVTRIVPENPSVNSVICVSGSLESLPVSRAYDAFVRAPTGIVEGITGHAVYRTDVSAPIESGDSWQLGLFLAHLLKREDLLAERGEQASCDLLVTGRLDRDLEVGSVEHVAEKLARAGQPAAGQGLFVFPAGGALPAGKAGWSLHPVATAEEALAAVLGPERAGRICRTSKRNPSVRRRAPASALLVGAGFLLLAGIAAILDLSGAAPWRTARDQALQSMLLLEIVPRSKEGCGAPVAVSPNATSFGGMACAAILSIRHEGEYRIAMSVSGAFLDYVDPNRFRIDQHIFVRGGDRSVRRIDFPYWVRRPVRLDVEVMRLGLDGAPLRSARRSIELRPKTTAEY